MVESDEVQKLSADVCLYVHTVRWIKPNYVSLSVLAAILCGVKSSLFDEMSEIRQLMAAGRCFIIVGGYIKDDTCMLLNVCFALLPQH